MTALGPAIYTIRKRLDKTMVEFAEMIGCRQSTVSRYESGKLIPGRSVLILLLQLARGSERRPVLRALGVPRPAATGWSEQDLVSALKTFEDYLESSRGTATRGASSGPLTDFARAAKRIVLDHHRVDPALVRILRYWLAHHSDPRALEHFRHVAAYLEVELRILAGRSARAGRQSRRKTAS